MSNKITIQLEQHEVDYINNFLFSHRCKLDLLTKEQRNRKPFKDYLKTIASIEKKLSKQLFPPKNPN